MTATCEGCNVCLHGECYACMVGVATGPESHDTCCSASSVTFRWDWNGDGCTTVQHGDPVHRVHVELLTGNPVRWACWCGVEGYAAPDEAFAASDKHIRYDAGETRADVNGPDPWAVRSAGGAS